MFHRIPPKPLHYDKAGPGQCRYCGDTVLGKQGKPKTRPSWHEKCVVEYRVIYWPSSTRRAVWERDKGKCADCGIVSPWRGAYWHVDHKKPLVEARGDLSYWKLPNLQTLCVPCHKKKTGAEATSRALTAKSKK